jgi:thymidylate synthase ThyX
MTYAAKVIADSIASGVRLTTMEVTFPRIILAEFNTHRMFSRNSASSRAIPVSKRIDVVRENPYVPEAFLANQKGMQAGGALDEWDNDAARSIWLRARDEAVESATLLAQLGVHKQWANRLLEPFSWTTVVVTATEWENYFNLRISSLAQPEIRRVSELMRDAMAASKPVKKRVGEWHLPYVQPLEYGSLVDLRKMSVARCARVSYLTQDGRADPNADIALHDRLASARHMSPFEHVAQVNQCLMGFGGNFRAPWWQLRKTMADESIAPAEAK